MRQHIIQTILQEKNVAILRGVERDALIPLTEALYRGGIRLLELTYDARGAVSDEETAARIALLINHWQGRMLIGAGTVLNEEQVNLTAEAGGGFIISPDINEAVIRRTVARGLVSIPGALTPSEITSAHRAGADFVKLFPIADLGINYVKSVRAPLSHIRLLAVGGINTQNISDYLKAGVCGFGIGSNIIDKEMLQRGDFKGIESFARDYTEAVKV